MGARASPFWNLDFKSLLSFTRQTYMAKSSKKSHNGRMNKTLSALRIAKVDEWRATVSHHLREAGGNLRVAAKTLDIDYSTLKRWCSEDDKLGPHNAPGRPPKSLPPPPPKTPSKKP
jgi:hypothetical protein